MTTRPTLPQEYVSGESSLVDDCELISGVWTDYSVDPSIFVRSLNTDEFKTGSKSIKTAFSTTGSATMYKTLSSDAAALINSNPTIEFWYYLHTETDTLKNIVVMLSTKTGGGGISPHFYVTYQPTVFFQGWNKVIFKKSDFTAYPTSGDVHWSDTFTRFGIQITCATGKICTVSIDDIRVGLEHIPTCIITFDDGAATQYSVAYAYMQPRGIPGTCYVVTDLVDSSAAYMTTANLETMYADGWAMGNHTEDHAVLTLLTYEQMIANIQGAQDWLDAHGFTRSSRHFCYPGGIYNTEVVAAVAEVGCLTARTVDPGFPRGNFDLLIMKRAISMTNTVTLDAACAEVDRAIAEGETFVLLVHKITTPATAPDSTTVEIFQALIDYIISKRIRCLTIDEWYNGLTNPRYRSLPVGRT